MNQCLVRQERKRGRQRGENAKDTQIGRRVNLRSGGGVRNYVTPTAGKEGRRVRERVYDGGTTT